MVGSLETSDLESGVVSLLDTLLPPGVKGRPDALGAELGASLAPGLVEGPLAFYLALAAYQAGSLLGTALGLLHGRWRWGG